MARYAGVLKATNGGLTVSGGEPLMQPAFTARLLRGAKELGLHTAIDTSGYLGKHASDEMLADIDLVLLDVKSGLPETYRRVTGRELLRPSTSAAAWPRPAPRSGSGSCSSRA